MRSFVKFGIKTSGAMFIVCEILFLVNLLLIIVVPFADLTIWTWIGIVLLGLYNIIMLIEYYGERRV